MFERFTTRARRVVVLAQEESRLLNHNYIGTEHLLLGLIRDGDSVGARALQSLGLSLDGVRSKVEDTIGRGSAAPPSGHIPFTPRAKKVLELSLREAMQLGHNYIGTEHILLGVLREGDGVGAKVLHELGAELAMVRHRVIELLPSEPEEPGPDEGAVFPEAPLCPRCGESLTTTAGYRTVRAACQSPDETPKDVVIVYCTRCGNALGTAP